MSRLSRSECLGTGFASTSEPKPRRITCNAKPTGPLSGRLPALKDDEVETFERDLLGDCGQDALDRAGWCLSPRPMTPWAARSRYKALSSSSAAISSSMPGRSRRPAGGTTPGCACETRSSPALCGIQLWLVKRDGARSVWLSLFRCSVVSGIAMPPGLAGSCQAVPGSLPLKIRMEAASGGDHPMPDR
jgi:hypothetical protein